MSRWDNVGLFWQDVPVKKGPGERTPRMLADIPNTGWKCPTYFPNLTSAPAISFDVETYDPELVKHGPGWGRHIGHICGFSVAVEGGHRWYYPLSHTVRPEENHPNPEMCLLWLKDTLALPCPKIGANLIYDVGWCNEHGIAVNGDLIDVQFAEALLDDRAKVNLENLGQRWLGEGKTTDLLKKWVIQSYAPPEDKWRREIYRSPPSLVGPYGEVDADLPLRIIPKMYEALWSQGLINLFRMECGLIKFLVKMRMTGVRVNLDAAQKLSDSLKVKVDEEQKVIDDLAGFSVNVDAAASLAKAFDQFGIKYPRTKATKGHPKGQASFRKEFLETVDHPFAGRVRQKRRYEKLKNTFIDGYVLNGHVNGRLYCSFHPLRGEAGGTIVGRFSSSSPNLTNVPVRDPDLGKPIRAIFCPDEGHVQWRKYDYSQIQFRFLVHYATGTGANDARLRYNLHPETDYHAMVQTLVEEITGRKWDRRPIKNLNFGKAFGMGDKKAAVSTGLKGEELKHFLDGYDKAVPFAKSTMQWCMNLAKRQGWVPTILGRRAKYDLWEPERVYQADREMVDEKEYEALPYELAVRKYGSVQRAYIHTSFPKLLQGCEGDTIKSFLYRCWNEGVFDYVGLPRLLVHDEADFSDPGGKEDAWEYMQHVMETCVTARVPIIAEGDIGPDWGHTEPIKCGCGHKLHRGRKCETCTCSKPLLLRAA